MGCRCYNRDTGEDFIVEDLDWWECESLEGELRRGLNPEWECWYKSS